MRVDEEVDDRKRQKIEKMNTEIIGKFFVRKWRLWKRESKGKGKRWEKENILVEKW